MVGKSRSFVSPPAVSILPLFPCLAAPCTKGHRVEAFSTADPHGKIFTLESSKVPSIRSFNPATEGVDGYLK